MKAYEVEIQRTSFLTLEIQAKTAADAESAALACAESDYGNQADYKVTVCKPRAGQAKTVKVQTRLLSGPALDWATAQASGYPVTLGYTNGETVVYDLAKVEMQTDDDWLYSPQSDWLQVGAIIEREGITVSPATSDDGALYWQATKGDYSLAAGSPLLAIMRCFVAAHLGYEVEIPAQLAKP